MTDWPILVLTAITRGAADQGAGDPAGTEKLEAVVAEVLGASTSAVEGRGHGSANRPLARL
jgi:hypothetical protein